MTNFTRSSIVLVVMAIAVLLTSRNAVPQGGCSADCHDFSMVAFDCTTGAGMEFSPYQSFKTLFVTSPAYPGHMLVTSDDNINIRAWKNCTCLCGVDKVGNGACGAPVGIFTVGPKRKDCKPVGGGH